MTKFFAALAITTLLGVTFHLRDAAATDATAPTGHHTRKPVKFADCASASLRIVLNSQDKTSKPELVEALKILGDYPQFEIRPVHAEEAAVAFTASAPSCIDPDCASSAGWITLQKRLLRLRDVAITCDDSRQGGVSAPKQEAPSQDQHGGVTGGSGGE